jgi:hypothetical protein
LHNGDIVLWVVRYECWFHRDRLRLKMLHAHAMVSIRSTIANTLSQYHNESVLKKYQDRLKVGTLKESAKL